MKRLPKEKVSLSIYVSPKCKKKLECLQQLYFIADKRFSLSEIVEESVNMIYGAAYLCQDSVFWKAFFKVGKVLDTSEASRKGIDEVLAISQSKKAAAKEILSVPIDVKENVVEDFKKSFRGKEE